jgi:hypothetical protein
MPTLLKLLVVLMTWGALVFGCIMYFIEYRRRKAQKIAGDDWKNVLDVGASELIDLLGKRDLAEEVKLSLARGIVSSAKLRILAAGSATFPIVTMSGEQPFTAVELRPDFEFAKRVVIAAHSDRAPINIESLVGAGE